MTTSSPADPGRESSIPENVLEIARARAIERGELPAEIRRKVATLVLAQKSSRIALGLTSDYMLRDLAGAYVLRASWIAPNALEACSRSIRAGSEFAAVARHELDLAAQDLRLGQETWVIADRLEQVARYADQWDDRPSRRPRSNTVEGKVWTCVDLLDACLLDHDILAAAFGASLGGEDLIVDLLLMGSSQRDAVLSARSVGAPVPPHDVNLLRASVPDLVLFEHWGLLPQQA